MVGKIRLEQLEQTQHRFVDAGGSAEFTTIQEAIDAATAGDVINIAAGDYPEKLTISSLDDITLIGEGSALIGTSGSNFPLVRINPTLADTEAAILISGGASRVALVNLYVRPTMAVAGTGYGIRRTATPAITAIKDCYVAPAGLAGGTGTLIALQNETGDLTVYDSIFTVADTVSQLTVARSIAVTAGNETRLYNCHALASTGATSLGDMQVGAAATVRLFGCTIDDVLDKLTGAGTVSADNGTSWGSLAGDLLDKIHRVDGQDPNADFATIQAAIDAASDGDTILVAPGDYAEQIVIDIEVAIIGLGGWNRGNPNASPVRIVPIISSTGAAISRTGVANNTYLENLYIRPTWTGATGTCRGVDMDGTCRLVNCFVGATTDTGAGSATNVYALDAAGGTVRPEHCTFVVDDPANLISTGDIYAVRMSAIASSNRLKLFDCELLDGQNTTGDMIVTNVTPIIYIRGTVIRGTLDNTINSANINIEVSAAIGTISGTTPNFLYHAIHDNVDGEINAITTKATPVSADVLMVEDSTASFAKKKVTIGSLPGGGGDTISVNGSATAATNVDLDDATPAAPAGEVNVKWQKDALDPTNVSASVQASTEALKGVIELATQAETDAGTDDARAVTPLKLAQSQRREKSITVEDPTASEDIGIFFTNRAITITEIRAVVRGASPSVTWTVRHGTDRSATGAEAVTSGTTTTSQSTGSDVTTFNDATVVADSFVWLETTAQTGTVDEISITIFYTED